MQSSPKITAGDVIIAIVDDHNGDVGSARDQITRMFREIVEEAIREGRKDPRADIATITARVEDIVFAS